MVRPNIILIAVFSVIILSTICYLTVMNKPATNSIQQFDTNSLNRPFEPGIYEYEFETAPSPAYPSGKYEKGIRTITNEVFGQRNISRGTLSYINNNGQLITKEDYCEHIFMTDLYGKKIRIIFGNLGNHGTYELVSENDDSFTYQSVYRVSNLMMDNIHKQISTYTKTKDGYNLEAVHYDKNLKKMVPYRWGIQPKMFF